MMPRHLRPVLYRIALAGCLLGAQPLFAGPAPYYLWMSLVDGSRICTQTPPGPGWKQMGGPFKDSVCRKPA
jgi:hypothetical protein